MGQMAPFKRLPVFGASLLLAATENAGQTIDVEPVSYTVSLGALPYRLASTCGVLSLTKADRAQQQYFEKDLQHHVEMSFCLESCVADEGLSNRVTTFQPFTSIDLRIIALLRTGWALLRRSQCCEACSGPR